MGPKGGKGWAKGGKGAAAGKGAKGAKGRSKGGLVKTTAFVKRTPTPLKWVQVPVNEAPKWKAAGKGKGKGKGKAAPAKGAGKARAPARAEGESRLDEFDASQKVWVGGVDPATTFKELQTHFRTAGNVAWAEVIGRKGTACVVFKNAGAVAKAIGQLDGTELGGQAINVDVWTEKQRKGKGKGKGAAKGKGKGKASAASQLKTKIWKPAFEKKAEGKGKGKGKKGKAKDNVGSADASCKVWIGNVAEGVDVSDIEAVFKTAGKTAGAKLLKKGSACVAYKTAEDAASAIASLNGAEVGGQAIEVDAWTTKPAKSD